MEDELTGCRQDVTQDRVEVYYFGQKSDVKGVG